MFSCPPDHLINRRFQVFVIAVDPDSFHTTSKQTPLDTIKLGLGYSQLRQRGAEHELDVLILATGFSTTKYLSAIDVTGRHGKRIDDAWKDGACAYLGITTAGFPNLFMIYGPNTNNGSILTLIESQVDYASRQIQRIADERLAWIDVRPEPMERYNEEIQRAIEGIAVWRAECHAYYRSASGRIVTQWPYSMSEYQKRTNQPDTDAYEVAPMVEAPAA